MSAAPEIHGSIVDEWGFVAAQVNCPTCSGRIHGQPISGRCPGCNAAVAEIVGRHIGRLDADGRLVVSIFCPACNYNLRSLPVLGSCPECDTPIVRTAFQSYLYHASSKWVRGLARGAALLFGGAVVFLIVPVITFLLWVLPVPVSPWAAPVSAWSIPASVAIIAGLSMLTARDPRAHARRDGLTRRRLVRIALIVALVSALVLATDQVFLGLLLEAVLPWFWSSAGVSWTVVLGGIAFVWLCLLAYIIELMKRVPRRGVATFAAVMFWLTLVSTFLWFVVATLQRLVGAGYGATVTYLYSTTRPATAPGSAVMYTPAATPWPATAPVAIYTSTAGTPAGLLQFYALALALIAVPLAVAAVVLLYKVWRTLADAAKKAAALESSRG